MTPHPTIAPTWRTAFPPAGDRLRHAADTLRVWLARLRLRHELEQLDDHLLRDIGLSREQLRAEAQRPFWQG